MALEFVIIPSKKNYEDSADDVEGMMKNNIKHNMIIEFDKNYDDSLNSRINKWKKKEYNVIIIDEEYPESNYLTIRFYDKGSKPKKMKLGDFIDIVSSFEDEEEVHDINGKSDDANQEGGCIIM
jgi:hypothetical protein